MSEWSPALMVGGAFVLMGIATAIAVRDIMRRSRTLTEFDALQAEFIAVLKLGPSRENFERLQDIHRRMMDIPA